MLLASTLAWNVAVGLCALILWESSLVRQVDMRLEEPPTVPSARPDSPVLMVRSLQFLAAMDHILQAKKQHALSVLKDINVKNRQFSQCCVLLVRGVQGDPRCASAVLSAWNARIQRIRRNFAVLGSLASEGKSPAQAALLDKVVPLYTPPQHKHASKDHTQLEINLRAQLVHEENTVLQFMLPTRSIVLVGYSQLGLNLLAHSVLAVGNVLPLTDQST